jgi:hypothetical protein
VKQLTLKEKLRFLRLQRFKGFETPTEPELDPETIAFLEAELAKARLYVEYGSGGSTILADRLGTRTISVESDRWYAAAVRKGLHGSSVTILTPNIGLTGPWGYPMLRRKTWWRLRKWRRYVVAPFASGEVPDLIFVDGRFRVACALEAARRILELRKQATIIIDDYEGRPEYRKVEQHLGPARMVGRSGVFRVVDQTVPEVQIEDIR